MLVVCVGILTAEADNGEVLFFDWFDEEIERPEILLPLPEPFLPNRPNDHLDVLFSDEDDALFECKALSPERGLFDLIGIETNQSVNDINLNILLSCSFERPFDFGSAFETDECAKVFLFRFSDVNKLSGRWKNGENGDQIKIDVRVDVEEVEALVYSAK